MTNPEPRTGREPSLGRREPPAIVSGDEPSLPGEFLVLKALLENDVSSIPAFGGYNRIERMQAIRQRGKAALPALLELCHHPDHHVQETAMTVLGWVGDPEAIPALIDVLTDEANHTPGRFLTGRTAAVALRNIGIAAQDSLISLLDHPNVRVRRDAAEALGFMRSKKAIPRFSRMMSEETDDGVRIHLFRALRRIGAPEVLPAYEAAVNSGNHTLDGELLLAIYQIGGTEAANCFVRLYETANPRARNASLVYLGKLKEPRCREMLIRSLKSPDRWERLAAANGCLYFGDPTLVPEIEPLLEDMDEPFRQAAAHVIERLQAGRAAGSG